MTHLKSSTIHFEDAVPPRVGNMQEAAANVMATPAGCEVQVCWSADLRSSVQPEQNLTISTLEMSVVAVGASDAPVASNRDPQIHSRFNPDRAAALGRERGVPRTAGGLRFDAAAEEALRAQPTADRAIPRRG